MPHARAKRFMPATRLGEIDASVERQVAPHELRDQLRLGGREQFPPHLDGTPRVGLERGVGVDDGANRRRSGLRRTCDQPIGRRERGQREVETGVGPSPRRTSNTTVPTPRRTATSAPMPLAQKPSICRSSRRLRRGDTEIHARPRPPPARGRCAHRRATRSMPEASSSPRNPMSTQGAAPMRRPLTHAGIAARRLQVGVHDEEPVHALRLRAEQLHAVPLGKGGQRRVRGAADEIDLLRRASAA